MKKIFYAIFALLLVMPLFTNAKVSKVDVPYGEENIVESGENTDGTFYKTYEVFAVTTDASDEVTELVVKFRKDEDANSEISKIACKGVGSFTATEETKGGYNVCTYKVTEGQSGEKSSDKKVKVGTVTITIPNQASNCNLKYQYVSSNGTVNTGAALNISLIALGIAGVGFIYYTTKSKKKMYNI